MKFNKRRIYIGVITVALLIVVSTLYFIGYKKTIEAKKYTKTMLWQNNEYASSIAQYRKTFDTKEVLYFSASGNDKNNGLTPNKPKRNPGQYIAAGNYTILLKSGDVFERSKTDKVGANVIISTYGEGGRAGLSYLIQSRSPLKLIDVTNNIYVASVSNDKIGYIVIDGNDYWHRVHQYSLMNDGEYYFDSGSRNIYIKSLTDISGKYIRYAYGGDGLHLSDNKCVVENIEIAGAGVHGINVGSCSDIIIQNCYIHDIGGAYLKENVKLGNGIQIWTNSTNNVYVYNNVVTDCFDAGITAQVNDQQITNSSNILFANNLVSRCTYGFECFDQNQTYSIKNLVVANNIFYDIRDITGGYRLTGAKIDYSAFLCLWNFGNTQNEITIKNNIGFKSQKYAISYSFDDSKVQYINFDGNKLICQTNDSILFPQEYTGDKDEYMTVKQTDSLYKNYEADVSSLMEKYDQTRIIW